MFNQKRSYANQFFMTAFLLGTPNLASADTFAVDVVDLGTLDIYPGAQSNSGTTGGTGAACFGGGCGAIGGGLSTPTSGLPANNPGGTINLLQGSLGTGAAGGTSPTGAITFNSTTTAILTAPTTSPVSFAPIDTTPLVYIPPPTPEQVAKNITAKALDAQIKANGSLSAPNLYPSTVTLGSSFKDFSKTTGISVPTFLKTYSGYFKLKSDFNYNTVNQRIEDLSMKFDGKTGLVVTLPGKITIDNIPKYFKPGTGGQYALNSVGLLGANEAIVIQGDSKSLLNVGLFPNATAAYTTQLQGTTHKIPLCVIPTDLVGFHIDGITYHELFWAGMHTLSEYYSTGEGSQLVLAGDPTARAAWHAVVALGFAPHYEDRRVSATPFQKLFPMLDGAGINYNDGSPPAAELFAMSIQPPGYADHAERGLKTNNDLARYLVKWTNTDPAKSDALASQVQNSQTVQILFQALIAGANQYMDRTGIKH